MTSMSNEESKMINEAQKKLNWAALSYKAKFRCEVIGYDGNDYRVRFDHRGRFITIESIPKKEINDLKRGVRNSPYLEQLFGWVSQMVEGKGKS